ncbi:MAG TPA: methyl-viologen-reducing hydrogenase subunit delta [Peptococcaceae bacterium]|nr:methyl-viologen-reducing hydrogenase subunit delta [Peptococcaceae bacterium]
MPADFEPRIIAFLCNWCSYAGADLAGSLRYSYPPNIHIIRVPCSGRVDPAFILKALFCGADGVFVGGCHPGDCHYVRGNYYAERRVKVLHRLLDWLGLERERVRLEWVSASEGAKFAATVTDFTTRLRELGPNSLQAFGVDYQALARVATVVGSVGKLVLEESVCMVDLARYFVAFAQKESCALCIPCRIGTRRLLEILERVAAGKTDAHELALLEALGEAMGPAARCDLGRMAGKIVANAVRCCRDDFEAHLSGRCPGTVEPNPGWQAVVGGGS